MVFVFNKLSFCCIYVGKLGPMHMKLCIILMERNYEFFGGGGLHKEFFSYPYCIHAESYLHSKPGLRVVYQCQ